MSMLGGWITVPEMARRQGVPRSTLLKQMKRLRETPEGAGLVLRVGGRWYVDPTMVQLKALTERVAAIEADVAEQRVGLASFVKWGRSIDARLATK